MDRRNVNSAHMRLQQLRQLQKIVEGVTQELCHFSLTAEII